MTLAPQDWQQLTRRYEENAAIIAGDPAVTGLPLNTRIEIFLQTTFSFGTKSIGSITGAIRG